MEGLLFYWDKKRNLSKDIVDVIDLDTKMLILRRLALEMQTKGIAEVKEEDLLNSFKDSLKNTDKLYDIKEILNNICDRMLPVLTVEMKTEHAVINTTSCKHNRPRTFFIG